MPCAPARRRPTTSRPRTSRGSRRRTPACTRGWRWTGDGALAAARDADAALARARADGPAALAALHPLHGVPVALKDLISVRGGPTHRRLPDPRGVSGAVRRPRHRAAPRGRRGRPRQDEHGRVRDGLVLRALRLRPHVQPLGPRPRARRLLGRVGRRRGLLPGAARARLGHGRVDPPARRALRGRRDEAHVRTRLALRDRGVRVVARPDRAVRARRARRRGAAPRGRRPRRPRLDVRPRRGARRPPGAARLGRRGGVRPARRPAGAPARVLRRRGWSPAWRPASARPWPRWRRPGRSSRRSPSRTPTTASRRTTSSPRRRRAPTSRGTTASGSGSPCARGDVLANYLATRGRGFGPEVKRRIMLGTYALSAGYYDAVYGKAQKVRTLLKADFDAVWASGVDAIVAPVSPVVAWPFGAKLDDPVAMYLADVCTVPVNLAGLPGVSIPAGLADGLPVGLQLIGRPWSELELLRIARGHEGATAGAAWRSVEPTGPRRAPRGRPAHADGSSGGARRRGPLTRKREGTPDDRLLHARLGRHLRGPRARSPRQGGPAVGDPPLLRHRRVDARRHQPRHRRARLRHPAGDRRGRDREPPRRPDALLQQLRHAGAAPAPLRPSREALRRPLRPRPRDHHHDRRVGGRGHRRPRDGGPGRRGRPPRALVRRVHAGDPLRGRDTAVRADADRGGLRPRPGRGRGGDRPEDEGDLPRVPVQPDRRGPPRRRPGPDRGDRRPPRPARVLGRDLRPARVRRPRPPRDERASRGCASGRSSWAGSARPTR